MSLKFLFWGKSWETGYFSQWCVCQIRKIPGVCVSEGWQPDPKPIEISGKVDFNEIWSRTLDERCSVLADFPSCIMGIFTYLTEVLWGLTCYCELLEQYKIVLRPLSWTSGERTQEFLPPSPVFSQMNQVASQGHTSVNISTNIQTMENAPCPTSSEMLHFQGRFVNSNPGQSHQSLSLPPTHISLQFAWLDLGSFLRQNSHWFLECCLSESCVKLVGFYP